MNIKKEDFYLIYRKNKDVKKRAFRLLKELDMYSPSFVNLLMTRDCFDDFFATFEAPRAAEAMREGDLKKYIESTRKEYRRRSYLMGKFTDAMALYVFYRTYCNCGEEEVFMDWFVNKINNDESFGDRFISINLIDEQFRSQNPHIPLTAYDVNEEYLSTYFNEIKALFSVQKWGIYLISSDLDTFEKLRAELDAQIHRRIERDKQLAEMLKEMQKSQMSYLTSTYKPSPGKRQFENVTDSTFATTTNKKVTMPPTQYFGTYGAYQMEIAKHAMNYVPATLQAHVSTVTRNNTNK